MEVAIGQVQLRANHNYSTYGNGYAKDFIGNDKVYILDVYNRNIYPCDKKAKKGIARIVELDNYTSDSEYLYLIKQNLKQALDEFRPDLMVYNAGTDVLEGDSLGRLAITPDGIIQRDELVFQMARDACIPIVMLTSGGYLQETAIVIAHSIENLHRNRLIVGPDKK
nr:histone deacetylase 11-like [Onthophagus taurus]